MTESFHQREANPQHSQEALDIVQVLSVFQLLHLVQALFMQSSNLGLQLYTL